MAKNFPYFKFVAAEWLTGDIVFEPLEVQGLFINICAIYWQRDGNLSIEDIEKRYKQSVDIRSLSGRFFSVKDGKISIKFLDEQLVDAGHISKVNSVNGKKGAEARAAKLKEKQATAKRPLSENKRPLSKEEEKKKKEELFIVISEIVNYLNQKTGKKFKAETSVTKTLISARLKNYSIEEAKKVIDIKCAQWIGDSKMQKYLAPDTLFAEKNFEKYLNETPAIQQKVLQEIPASYIFPNT